MKKILLSLLAMANCVLSFAKQVSEETAKTVGYNFLRSQTHTATPANATGLQLAYKVNAANGTDVALYVFNTGSNGFVIVSGDDVANPVLGYSNEGGFNAADIPANVTYWMNGCKTDITYAIAQKVPATATVKNKWSALDRASVPAAKATATAVVGPLVKTKWKQSPTYNAYCPYDATAGSNAITGCVATAMAQVMKYWNYPATGQGSNSYTPYSNPQYGVQSANFGATTYDWDHMGTVISNGNIPPIATLMYHAGVSVNMDYGTDASGAYVTSSMSPITNCAEYALRSYFKYKSSLQGVERNNYNTDQWLLMMKWEINSGRPVIYAGYGNEGGHCWVADGYDVNDFLHLNWGWGGVSDGYFSADAMDPAAMGPGNGFDWDHHAIIGILPSQPGVEMDLNAQVAAPPTIEYNHSFSISSNIINNGTDSFKGDYIARVFDDNGNFVDSIELRSNNTLVGGNQTGTLTFTSTGSAAMIPGNYTIGIYYRPTGRQWVLVNDNGNNTNLVQVAVGFATEVNEVAKATGIKVYPNPASDVLNITANGNITSVKISDLQGRVLKTLDVANHSNVSIPVSNLSSGIYFVQTITTAGTTTEKIVIRK